MMKLNNEKDFRESPKLIGKKKKINVEPQALRAQVEREMEFPAYVDNGFSKISDKINFMEN